MSGADVKIKLSADGSQVRREIKLIDQDMQKIGKNTSTGTSQSGSNTQQPASEIGSESKGSKKTPEQDQRDKVLSSIDKEISLLRKELRRLTGEEQGKSGSSPVSNTPSSSGGGGTPPSTPTSKKGGSDSPDSKTSGILGKLVTAIAGLNAASKAKNYVTSGAASSASGESLAYKTYGSTMAYSDYYTAKKDSTELGVPYGYNYETVMNAGSANMSEGGFTSLENYKTDMNALLGTSKAWGIDASSLAGASGRMTALGVADSGDQKKLANMLAESIVQADMQGRGDEQLQVLEEIAENIGSKSATVSSDALSGSLGMYTALVNQNSDLKGIRGASMVTSLQDAAASGNSSLLLLAGWNTSEYSGLEGKQALTQMAEENPDEFYQRVAQGVMSGSFGISADSPYLKELLHNQAGLSYSQADEFMKTLPQIADGSYKMSSTKEGEDATEERLKNYEGSGVSTNEQYDIQKQDTKESVGEGLNNLLSPFKDWYSNLGTGGRTAVDIGLGVGETALQIGGAKLLGKGAKSLISKIKGTGTASAGAASAASKGVTETAEGVASGATKAAEGVEEAVAGASKGATANASKGIGETLSGASNSVDDILSGAGKGISGIGSKLSEIVDSGKSWVGKGTESLKDVFSSLKGKISSGVDDLVKGASNSVDDIAKGASGGAKSAANSVDDVIKGVASGADDAVSGASKGLASAGEGISEGLSGASKGAGEALSGVGKGLSGFAKKIPLIGTAIGAVATGLDVKNELDEGDEKGAAGAAGSGIGGILGGLAGGAAAGAAVGTIVPGAGNVAGAVIGGIGGLLGAFGGSALGEAAGNGIYDAATGGENSSEDSNKSIIEDEATETNTKSISDLTESVDALNDTLTGQDNGGLPLSLSQTGTIGSTPISQLSQTSSVNSSSSTGISSYGVSSSSGNGKSTGSLWGTISTGIGNAFSGVSNTVGNFVNQFTSHATGNDYVPYDDYLASLHKGEMVLTKFEADEYRQGKTDGVKGINSERTLHLNVNVTGNIDGMTADNQNKIVNAVVSQINSSDLQGLLSTGFQRMANY